MSNERLLRWYPAAWRERYGGELIALMEDSHGAGRLPLAGRVDVVRAALVEHWRAFNPGPSDDRVLAGSLLVLCGWAFATVGGSGYAKFSEHWDAFTPGSAQRLPSLAYDTVVLAAAMGAVAVMFAALSVLPAFARLLRAGGWAQVGRPILRAGIVTATTAVASVGVILWVHHLGPAARNGGSFGYGVVAVIWGSLIVTSLGLGTAAAVGTVRRLQLSRRVIRVNAALACVVMAAMAVVAAAMVTWWVTVASRAPAFLSGAPLPLVAAAGCLLAGLTVGALGVRRIVWGPAA